MSASQSKLSCKSSEGNQSSTKWANAKLMKNSSKEVAAHQQRAFSIAEIAKEENKQMDVINQELLKKEENLINLKKKVVGISNNFSELEFFKGRFLKHIYLHQAEIDDEYVQESKDVAEVFKSLPPVYSAVD